MKFLKGNLSNSSITGSVGMREVEDQLNHRFSELKVSENFMNSFSVAELTAHSSAYWECLIL